MPCSSTHFAETLRENRKIRHENVILKAIEHSRMRRNFRSIEWHQKHTTKSPETIPLSALLLLFNYSYNVFRQILKHGLDSAYALPYRKRWRCSRIMSSCARANACHNLKKSINQRTTFSIREPDWAGTFKHTRLYVIQVPFYPDCLKVQPPISLYVFLFI
jgi:hypothetical protein